MNLCWATIAAWQILNNTKVVYINHSALNIIMTKDPVFTEYTYQHAQNLIRRVHTDELCG